MALQEVEGHGKDRVQAGIDLHWPGTCRTHPTHFIGTWHLLLCTEGFRCVWNSSSRDSTYKPSVCVALTSSQWSGGHLSWHIFLPFSQRQYTQPSSHSDPACLTHRKHTIFPFTTDLWIAGSSSMAQQPVPLSVTGEAV